MEGGYESDDSITTTSTVPEQVDPDAEYTIANILAERTKGNLHQCLVHWDGYPEAEWSWEPLKQMPTAAKGEWRATKKNIDEGREEAFDVAAWEERVTKLKAIEASQKADRKRRRRGAKRNRRKEAEARVAAEATRKRKAANNSSSSDEAQEENEIEDGRGSALRAQHKPCVKRQKITQERPSVPNTEDSDDDSQISSSRFRKRSSTAIYFTEQTPPITFTRQASSTVVEPKRRNSAASQTPNDVSLVTARNVQGSTPSSSHDQPLARLPKQSAPAVPSILVTTHSYPGVDMPSETSHQPVPARGPTLDAAAESSIGQQGKKPLKGIPVDPTDTPAAALSSKPTSASALKDTATSPKPVLKPASAISKPASTATTASSQASSDVVKLTSNVPPKPIVTAPPKAASAAEAKNLLLKTTQSAQPRAPPILSTSKAENLQAENHESQPPRPRGRPPVVPTANTVERGGAPAAIPRNVFSSTSTATGQAPRNTLREHAARTAIAPKLFTNMRLGRKAELRARDLAERAPDPAALEAAGGIFNPAKGPNKPVKLPSFQKVSTTTVVKEEPSAESDDGDDDDGDNDHEALFAPDRDPAPSISTTARPPPPAFVNSPAKSTCYFWDRHERNPAKFPACTRGYLCSYEHEYRIGMPIAQEPPGKEQRNIPWSGNNSTRSPEKETEPPWGQELVLDVVSTSRSSALNTDNNRPLSSLTAVNGNAQPSVSQILRRLAVPTQYSEQQNTALSSGRLLPASSGVNGRPRWNPYDRKRAICHFWYTRGNCTKGERCQYAHTNDPTLPIVPDLDGQRQIHNDLKIVCPFSEDGGDCSKVSCVFYHSSRDSSNNDQGDNVQHSGNTPGGRDMLAIATPPTSVSHPSASQVIRPPVPSRPLWNPEAPRDSICYFYYTSGDCDNHNCQYRHTEDGTLALAPSPDEQKILRQNIKNAAKITSEGVFQASDLEGARIRDFRAPALSMDVPRPQWDPMQPYESVCHFWLEGNCRDGQDCLHHHTNDMRFPVTPKPSNQMRLRTAFLESGFGIDISPTSARTRPQWNPWDPAFSICYYYWHDDGRCGKGIQCAYLHTRDPRIPIAPYPSDQMRLTSGRVTVWNMCDVCGYQHPGARPAAPAVNGYVAQRASRPAAPAVNVHTGNRKLVSILATPRNESAAQGPPLTASGGGRKSVKFAMEPDQLESLNDHENGHMPRRQWSKQPRSPPPDTFADISPGESAIDAATALVEVPKRTKIDMNAYRVKKGIQPAPSTTKEVLFGLDSKQSIILDFGKIDVSDDHSSKAQFAATSKIVLDQLCLGYDLKMVAKSIVSRKLWQANVRALDIDDSTAKRDLEQTTSELNSRCAGLRGDFGQFAVLIYPARQSTRLEWGDLDNFEGVTDDILLRYCVFETTEQSQAPRLEPRSIALSTSGYARPLFESVYGLTIEQVFNPILTKVFLLASPAAHRTADFLLWLVRLHLPKAKIYTSLIHGSWNAFAASGPKGIAFIHESAVSELDRLPGLGSTFQSTDLKVACWYISDSTTRYPLFPSRYSSQSIPAPPPYISATRIFPHGCAFFLTPSFLIAEPEKTIQILNWFLFQEKTFKKVTPYRLICCHNFVGYMLDLAKAKAEEREDYEKRHANEPSKDYALETKGLSWSMCNKRFELWGALIAEQQKSLAGLGGSKFTLDLQDEISNPLIYAPAHISPDDEVELTKWFAGWSMTRLDIFRKFVVFGTSNKTDSRRLHKLARKKDVSMSTTLQKRTHSQNSSRPSTPIKFELQALPQDSVPRTAANSTASAISLQKAQEVAAKWKTAPPNGGLTVDTKQQAHHVQADEFLASLSATQPKGPSNSYPRRIPSLGNPNTPPLAKIVTGLWTGDRPSSSDSMNSNGSSGEVQGANGQRFVPASARQDKSLRKELRIKPGYVVPEDVRQYRHPNSGRDSAANSRSHSPAIVRSPMEIDSAVQTSLATERGAEPQSARIDPDKEYTTVTFEPTTVWYQRQCERGEVWEHLLIGDYEVVAPVIGLHALAKPTSKPSLKTNGS